MAQALPIGLFCLLIAALVLSVRFKFASKEFREYNDGDYIPVFVSTTQPDGQGNARPYFDLPFCLRGVPVSNRKKSYKEVLEGDCFTNTRYELNFKVDKIGELLCEKDLTDDEVAIFKDAVKNKFGYKMYYDRFSHWNFVGVIKVDEDSISMPRHYLNKDIYFHGYYSGSKLLGISIIGNPNTLVDITDASNLKVNFTYTVLWNELNIDDLDHLTTWKEESYDWVPTMHANHIFKKAAYAFSTFIFIGWSLFVILWLASIAIPWQRIEIATKSLVLIQANTPNYHSFRRTSLSAGKILFCALLLLAFVRFLFPLDINSHSTWVMTYCFSSAVCSVVLSFCPFQRTVSGPIQSLLRILLLSLSVTMSLASLLDLLVVTGELSLLAELGIGAIVVVLATKLRYSFREMPSSRRILNGTSQMPWYMRTPAQMLLGGFIPFIVRFLAMDDIYASLYGLKVCGAFSTLLRELTSIVALTVIVSLIFSKMQLFKPDDNWEWRPVLRGGSPAIYIYSYGILFHAKTGINDDPLILRFMAFNACSCCALFLILGAAGYYASLLIIHPSQEPVHDNRTQ